MFNQKFYPGAIIDYDDFDITSIKRHTVVQQITLNKTWSSGGAMARRTYGEKKASFHYEDALDAYKITFPYDESIIEFIKLAVPSSKRSWNRDEKAWYVDASYKDAMALMLKGKGYTVDIFSKEDFVKFMEENAKFQQEYQRMSATVNA